MLGLGAGFLVWCYTLLLPAFVRSGWIHDTLLVNGPWGIGFLHPEHLFGVSTLDNLTHTVLWSMLFNVGLYFIGSLYSRQSEEEQSLAKDFVGALSVGPTLSPTSYRESNIDLAGKTRMIEELLGQYFTEPEAAAMGKKCVNAAGLDGKMRISIVELAELHSEVEKLLAGSVGTAVAHKALSQARIFMPSEARELSEVYAEILAELRVTPEELKRKIDYYQEREALLTHHAAELEQKVKERTSDLEAAQEELIKREKLSVLGQLTAIVSHELRNPLGVIRTSVYYVNRKMADADEKMRKHLDRIEQQVAICDSIIGELLEYTRGRRSAAVQGAINPWLEEILDQVTAPPEVARERDLARDLPHIYFDAEKMRRVVINLFENAVQAVLARQAAESDDSYRPWIRVQTARTANGILLRLEDNGIGMNRETASHAFEPLFTTRARGTGLGLAIVRKIVQEHGGFVSLSSEPHQGTSVTVVIPLQPPSPPVAASDMAPQQRSRS